MSDLQAQSEVAFPAMIKRADIDYWNAAVKERDQLKLEAWVLREVLKAIISSDGCAISVTSITKAHKVLTDTESTAAEYRKQIEGEALERAATKFQAIPEGGLIWSGKDVANELRAMKG